jgi:hypothetical protein
MNTKLREFDQELYDKFCEDMDRYEIRGSERIVIEDWIAKATVTESLLGLLRKGLVDINGLTVDEDGINFAPTFVQSELCKSFLQPPQP